MVGYCRAVRFDNQIFVSGTAPISEDGSVAAPGDPTGQARQCIEIAKTAIEALGGSLADVVQTRVYLADSNDWEKVGDAHRQYFSEIKPASTMLQVAQLLNPEWLVEIEFHAIVCNSHEPK